MSLFRASSSPIIPIWEGLPMRMPRRPGIVDVTKDSSLTHSAVWSAQRLRANLVSTMPLTVYRKMPDGIEVAMPTQAGGVLDTPSSHGPGQPIGIAEWLYSSQMDLDSTGNAFGIVRQRDALGFPKVIDLVAADTVTVSVKGGTIQSYRIGRDVYDPIDVWHERQNTVPGIHVGLSPVTYAARAIGYSLSAQQFALDWFSNGAVPGSILRNRDRTLERAEAENVKKQFMASVGNGEPFITGKDWEYSMIQAKAAEAEFLSTIELSMVEIARFFDVPADMIDASSGGSHITYANIVQRNLQFLIMSLAPVLHRREASLSRLTTAPRRVSFDTETLLRMDPKSLADMIQVRITSRNLTPDEARARYYNQLPLDADQIEQFHILFPAKGALVPDIVPPADAVSTPDEQGEVVQ